MSKNTVFEVETPRWYALVVKHQHERKLEFQLHARGWETLVPTFRSQRRWSDRIKEIELPLFAGYVFCRFSSGERMNVEDTPGVMRIVGFGGIVAPLEDRDVAEIQAMVASKANLSPWPFLKAGDRVLVEKGPLKGIEGTLLRDGNGTRLIVGVELLQRSIAAEIDPSMVVPLRRAAARA
ncbi:MAG: transcription termination/antitermination NusG family protein [Acidobacteriota bacterium]